MAQLYRIKCPKCGKIFAVGKGVFMSFDFSQPIPVGLRDETLFTCPFCNHEMCVLDKDFSDHVIDIQYLD